MSTFSGQGQLKFLKGNLPAPSMIYKFTENELNPFLDKTFRGIERLYHTSVIENVMTANTNPQLIWDRGTASKNPQYHCETGTLYNKIKQELLLAQQTESKIDPTYFRTFLEYYAQHFA